MRRVLWIALAVAIVALAVYWLQRPKPIPVDVASVERGSIERTVTNTRAGTLNACRRAQLSPSMGGQIASLPVSEGESVHTGQLLFEIWNDDLKAQLELARSELIASEAVRQQACIQAELAVQEAGRLSTLLARGLASDESAEKAVGQAQASQAACAAATARESVSRSRITVAEVALERTRLRAPFDGTIAEVNGELGEYVTPSPVGITIPPAVDIIDVSCLYVSAPIDEVDAPRVEAGQPARISLDAFGNRFFEGRVRRVAPYVLDLEKQARTVQVEVDFTGESALGNMLPGYTADVEIILEVREDSLRIPTQALLQDSQVYLYDANFGSVERIAVETGLENWQHKEIVGGLDAGQQIVTTINAEGLDDGASVTPNGDD